MPQDLNIEIGADGQPKWLYDKSNTTYNPDSIPLIQVVDSKDHFDEEVTLPTSNQFLHIEGNIYFSDCRC